jgi:ribosomal protein S18 acetylase RimI-like enzyme
MKSSTISIPRKVNINKAESIPIWNNEIVHDDRSEVLFVGEPPIPDCNPGSNMKIEVAQLENALEIMHWFTDKESVTRWGSPYMRYPLREQEFLEDIRWGEMETRIGVGDDGQLLAFGQFYPKLGRCHLARLVINPEFRDQGLGLEFVAALMKNGSEQLGADQFSLFVMTANKPAYNCYKHLGFSMTRYPDDDPKLEDCIFMVTGLVDQW